MVKLHSIRQLYVRFQYIIHTSAPTRLRRVSHLPALRDFGTDVVPMIFNKTDEPDICEARRRRVGAIVEM
ncbi:hypothetical protein Y032_0126g1303 [Ancylostoma ceylanicum]|uniref:Uncharacterized protein n=1 Tax=Ancylostoma ceylanicum TaxID=53326 RepID=A0A016T8B5_9BILA|nr:hypothetical protein Y032_0126g1303 [Ancylostoma ceylanicum]